MDEQTENYEIRRPMGKVGGNRSFPFTIARPNEKQENGENDKECYFAMDLVEIVQWMVDCHEH